MRGVGKGAGQTCRPCSRMIGVEAGTRVRHEDGQLLDSDDDSQAARSFVIDVRKERVRSWGQVEHRVARQSYSPRSSKRQIHRN